MQSTKNPTAKLGGIEEAIDARFGQIVRRAPNAALLVFICFPTAYRPNRRDHASSKLNTEFVKVLSQFRRVFHRHPHPIAGGYVLRTVRHVAVAIEHTPYRLRSGCRFDFVRYDVEFVLLNLEWCHGRCCSGLWSHQHHGTRASLSKSQIHRKSAHRRLTVSDVDGLHATLWPPAFAPNRHRRSH